MVLPVWPVEAVVEHVEPNVGDGLDAELRLHPWISNSDYTAIQPGDWERAGSTVALERQLIEEVDRASDSAEAFEERLQAVEGDHVSDEWGDLDLGVAGLVLALNAAGFATAMSCRLHVGEPPLGDAPFVFVTGDQDRINALTALVGEAEAGLYLAPPGQGFCIYGPTVMHLMRLARLILDERATFRAIPESIGWDQEAYDSEMD